MKKTKTGRCAGLRGLKGKVLVGLTGQVASGKSTALEMFAHEGMFTVSADALARDVLTRKECYNRIIRKLGRSVALADGGLDRYRISELVFSDKSLKKWLERLLHPLIIDRLYRLIKETPKKIVIADIPLLFESGLDKCFHLNICVYADRKRQFGRFRGRGWSEANMRARTAAQLPAEEKAARADITLDNNGTVGDLRKQVKLVCGALRQAARGI